MPLLESVAVAVLIVLLLAVVLLLLYAVMRLSSRATNSYSETYHNTYLPPSCNDADGFMVNGGGLGPTVKFKDVNGTPPSLPKGVISDAWEESGDDDIRNDPNWPGF